MELATTWTAPPEILVVDGDEEARRDIRRALSAGTLTCREATSGAECLQQVKDRKPDLVILDLYLPDQSGIGVCRLLRETEETERTPIIVVSSQASEIDRVVAFESGVDDFVPRPFYPAELRARVDAVLRGFGTARSREQAASIERGPVRVDDRAGHASVEGRRLGLTAKEFAMLRELVSRPGRVVRRRQLLERVWGEHAAPKDRAIDAHIKSIRKKLGPARDCIETVRGVGYRFVEEPVRGGEVAEPSASRGEA